MKTPSLARRRGFFIVKKTKYLSGISLVDFSPLEHGVAMRHNERQFYINLVTLKRQRIRELCIKTIRFLTEKSPHETNRIELKAIKQ